MTNATGSRPWWRLSRRSLIAVVVAAAVGIGIGVLVDIVSPNPTHGLQIEAIGLAVLIAIVVGVVPALRRLLPAGLALAIGVIVGVELGPGPTSPPWVVGTVEVRLAEPATSDASAAAECRVVAGTLEFLTTAPEALRLADGRSFGISLGEGEVEPAALDRPLDIVVIIRSTTSDGTPTETRMASNASSVISISNAGATGSMAFSALVLDDQSELREPIDVAGTLTWSCPA